jgi:hypothetical protein
LLSHFQIVLVPERIILQQWKVEKYLSLILRHLSQDGNAKMRFSLPEEFLNLTNMPEIQAFAQLFESFLFLARTLHL